jgi:hypothetical protein
MNRARRQRPDLRHALPAFEAGFDDLERSGEVFSWDPV